MKVRRPASPWRIMRAWLALNAGRATGAGEDELRALGQGVEQGASDQVHPLLAVEAADVADDRLPGVAEHQAITQGPLVLVLLLDGFDAEPGRDELVHLRVPHAVVQPVEHSAELVLVEVERVGRPMPWSV